MKKGFTELVFILDRSGSMGGLESDTIGGFNSMLQKQQAEPGECRITTILFDDKYEVLHDRIDLKAVNPVTEKEYYVRGMTALLDAIGKTIRKIDSVQKNTIKEHRAEKVLFVITTDGMENASRDYSYKKVRSLIERQKDKHGWEFLFLGANMDAVEVANTIGIMEDRAQSFHNDSAGVRLNYHELSETVSCFREADEALGCQISPSWKENINADYKRRGRK